MPSPVRRIRMAHRPAMAASSKTRALLRDLAQGNAIATTRSDLTGDQRARRSPLLFFEASVRDLNLENLTHGRTETDVGDVECAIGSEGHAGREEERAATVDQDLLLAVGQYANETAREGFGSGVARRIARAPRQSRVVEPHCMRPAALV